MVSWNPWSWAIFPISRRRLKITSGFEGWNSMDKTNGGRAWQTWSNAWSRRSNPMKWFWVEEMFTNCRSCQMDAGQATTPMLSKAASGCGKISLIFVRIAVRETKGKTLEAMQRQKAVNPREKIIAG